MMKKRAAAYIRMSTDRQDKSPERQREQIEAYARQKGYVIVGWYEDQGMRGWDTSRPGYQAILRDAQAGNFEVIVADELSRLSRLGTLAYFTQFIAPLFEAGVIVDTVSEGVLAWDDEDLGGAIMQLLQGYKGYSESRNLAERTAKGLHSRVLLGRLFVGPHPFGLNYSLDSEGNRIGYVPGPPEETAAVRLIFERYAQGDSLADIAGELNCRGILTRRDRPWNRNSLHAILTNPAYAGDYVFGRVARGKFYRLTHKNPQGHVRRRKKTKATKADVQRIPKEDWFILRDRHEAIIARPLFDRVQELLKENRKHTSPSRAKGEHPLSGLLLCPACGHVMYGTTRKCRERRPVYVCGRYIKSRECEGYFVYESEALTSIVHALSEKLADPTEVERLEASLLKHQDRDADNVQSLAEQLRQQIGRLDSQLAQAKARLARVPEALFDSYVAEIGRMESERGEAEAKLSQFGQPPNVVLDLKNLVEKVKELSKLIHQADSDLVHQLLRAVIDRVDLTIRVTRLPTYRRFVWEEGTIHLRKSQLLSANGPGR